MTWLRTLVVALTVSLVLSGSIATADQWPEFRPGERERVIEVTVQKSSIVCTGRVDADLRVDGERTLRTTVADVIKGSVRRGDEVDVRVGYLIGRPDIGDTLVWYLYECEDSHLYDGDERIREVVHGDSVVLRSAPEGTPRTLHWPTMRETLARHARETSLKNVLRKKHRTIVGTVTNLAIPNLSDFSYMQVTIDEDDDGADGVSVSIFGPSLPHIPFPDVGKRILMLVSEEPSGLVMQGGCYGLWFIDGSMATATIMRSVCTEEVERRVEELR